MKKLMSAENPFIVANTKQLLEQAGINCTIKNEFVGGASGEIPHFETWPELWVLEDGDFPRAEALLRDLNERSQQPEWICRFCQEKNPQSFEHCWNCNRIPAG